MSTELTTSEYTQEQARRFTDEIKRDGSALWQKVAEAYDGRIWIALGYESGQSGWQKYIADEFPDGLLIPPRDRVNDAIQHYLQQGVSTRAISQVTGLHQSTVVRHAREIRETVDASGDANASPGNVQGIDGKQYPSTQGGRQGSPDIEYAEIVDEGERPGSSGQSQWPAPGPNGRLAGDQTPAEEYGFEPLPLEPGGNELRFKEKTVKDIIRAYNGTGSSDAVQIKGTASELMEHLRSGMVPVEVWDEDELGVVAEDTVDTIAVLTGLLLCMVRGNRTGGVSLSAIHGSEIHGSLADVVLSLEELVDVLSRETAGH